MTFTPTDTADYLTATATAHIDVARADPVITWANPAAITYGTAGATQARRDDARGGRLRLHPASGMILHAGAGRDPLGDLHPDRHDQLQPGHGHEEAGRQPGGADDHRERRDKGGRRSDPCAVGLVCGVRQRRWPGVPCASGVLSTSARANSPAGSYAIVASGVVARSRDPIRRGHAQGDPSPLSPLQRSRIAAVTSLYLDLLGRTPEASGLAYWTGWVAQGLDRPRHPCDLAVVRAQLLREGSSPPSVSFSVAYAHALAAYRSVFQKASVHPSGPAALQVTPAGFSRSVLRPLGGRLASL